LDLNLFLFIATKEKWANVVKTKFATSGLGLTSFIDLVLGEKYFWPWQPTMQHNVIDKAINVITFIRQIFVCQTCYAKNYAKPCQKRTLCDYLK